MPDGSWSGVIGDLVKGEIDIAVAGMTMTRLYQIQISYNFQSDYELRDTFHYFQYSFEYPKKKFKGKWIRKY